jgi:hypothetical protein
MTKKKRIRAESRKPKHAHEGTHSIRPISGHTENELHQPDYLLEDHPELDIPSIGQNGGSPKQEHRAKK